MYAVILYLLHLLTVEKLLKQLFLYKYKDCILVTQVKRPIQILKCSLIPVT